MREEKDFREHVKIQQVFPVEGKKWRNYTGGTGFVIVIGRVACVSRDTSRK